MSRQQSLLQVIDVREDTRVRVRLRGEFDLAGPPTVTERLRSLGNDWGVLEGSTRVWFTIGQPQAAH